MDKILIERVKQHALDHYENGGWDVIVECWTDEELAQLLADYNATTFEAALNALGPIVDVWADRQADARNSAF